MEDEKKALREINEQDSEARRRATQTETLGKWGRLAWKVEGRRTAEMDKEVAWRAGVAEGG